MDHRKRSKAGLLNPEIILYLFIIQSVHVRLTLNWEPIQRIGLNVACCRSVNDVIRNCTKSKPWPTGYTVLIVNPFHDLSLSISTDIIVAEELLCHVKETFQLNFTIHQQPNQSS